MTKIAADWVVINEEQFIEKSIEALLPHIDYGVVIDTGSTDGTLDIVRGLQKKYPNLALTTCDIGGRYNISTARNVGVKMCMDAIGDGAWYVVVAGDEIYVPGVSKIQSVLDGLPTTARWVYAWAASWLRGKNDVAVLSEWVPLRPTIFRMVDGIRWAGCYGSEHIVYQGTGVVPSLEATCGFDRALGVCEAAHKEVLAYEHMIWVRSPERKRLHEQISKSMTGRGWQNPNRDWCPPQFRRPK